MEPKRILCANRTRSVMCCLLALLLVVGGVPVEALAEAIEEVRGPETVQELGNDSVDAVLGAEDDSTELGDASEDVIIGDAESDAEDAAKGTVFLDVTASTAHAQDIEWLANTGISAGWVVVEGKEFRPYANVARADMAAFLYRLAKLWRLVDDSWQPNNSVSFIDVDTGTSHYREVMWLAQSGISQGWTVADGREFRPYANVARADMAAFLHRMAGLAGIQDPHGSTINFEDVTPGTAHYEDIVWLSRTGITLGWQIGEVFEFRPFASVARADMAAFLHRLHLVWENAKPSDPVQQTYTIAYNANGGVGTMANQVVRRGASVALAPNAFTRSNCRFTGWNTKADGSGTSYADGASVSNLVAAGKTTTLYAQWRNRTLTVVYDANGGTNPPAPATVPIGKSVTVSNQAPTRAEFDFVGWNSKKDGSGVWYTPNTGFAAIDTTDNDLTETLYAQWKPKTYTIAYNANGGSGSMPSQTVACGANVALSPNAFTRSGYSFYGWNTKADGTGTFYLDKASVKDLAAAGQTIWLYAWWVPSTYGVHYYANDGTGHGWNDQLQCGVDEHILDCMFTRSGYDFVCWNTKPDGTGTNYNAGARVRDLAKEDEWFELYAQWGSKSYTVKYNANGGSGTMANQTIPRDKSTYLNANQYTRSGYTFKGWNTRSDGLGVSYSNQQLVNNIASAGGCITLYAQWGRQTYTVYFYANGGSGTMSAQTVEFNTYAYLKSNTYYRSGYTFAGWNTSSNGTGTSYANGERVYNLRSAGGSISLYAQWKRSVQTYTIYYNANGGTGGPGSQQVEVGQSAVLSTWAPTRAGYDFMGWNTRADGWGDEYQAGSSYSSNTGANGSVTLYAYWRRNYGNGWNDAYTWDIYNTYNEWRQVHGLSVVPVDVSNTCHIYAENCARGCANQRKLVHRLGIPADKQNQYSDILQYASWEMTGKEIVKRWESSPGHLAQMRCPTAGIGATGVVYQDGIYWYALVYTFQGTNVG